MKPIHGNKVANTIKRLNRQVADAVVTVAYYQQEARKLLRQVPDWQKRMHYENLCLLPVEWE